MHDPDAMMQSTEKEDSARKKNSKENQRIGTRSVLTSLKLRKLPSPLQAGLKGRQRNLPFKHEAQTSGVDLKPGARTVCHPLLPPKGLGALATLAYSRQQIPTQCDQYATLRAGRRRSIGQ
jgi:hypothetical protein